MAESKCMDKEKKEKVYSAQQEWNEWVDGWLICHKD